MFCVGEDYCLFRVVILNISHKKIKFIVTFRNNVIMLNCRGRTARFGKDGTAMSIILPDEMYLINRIKRTAGVEISKLPMEGQAEEAKPRRDQRRRPSYGYISSGSIILIAVPSLPNLAVLPTLCIYVLSSLVRYRLHLEIFRSHTMDFLMYIQCTILFFLKEDC